MGIKAKIKQKPFFRRDPATTLLITLSLFLLSQVIAVILISIYPATQNWTEAEANNWLKNSVSAQFFYVLVAEALLIGAIYYIVNKAKITWQRIGFVKPRLRDLGYALITYGLYFLTYLVVVILVGIFLPSLNLDQEQQIGFEGAVRTSELWMTFISLVILPPLAEELLFRGFVFSSFRAKYRLRYSVIFTSILFGIAHLQFGSGAPLLWVAAIDTFILSCYLCLLREKTAGVTAPIILHGLKNFVAFMILFGPRFI